MPRKLRSQRELKLFLDGDLEQGRNVLAHAQHKPILDMADKLDSLAVNDEDKNGLSVIRKAILDGVESYEKQHGHKPDVNVINVALDHAEQILDDANIDGVMTNTASNSRGLISTQVIVAIQALVSAAIPFAHYITGDKKTSKAELVVVSHSAGSKAGSYDAGDELDGIGGGDAYIMTDRTATLTASDETKKVFAGKITPIQLTDTTCDPDAAVHPLYTGRTQIIVNGLIVATCGMGSGDVDSFSGRTKLVSGEDALISGTVNIATGAVAMTSNIALGENDQVFARGVLNVEKEGAFKAPSIDTTAQKFVLYASPYRAKVVCTPEAKEEFENELGINPQFEGTIHARTAYSQETLYKSLRDCCLIGKYSGLSRQFDYKWETAGANKSQADITEELITLINTVSQDMANANGSHGVSHIYVGEKMRSIFESLPDSKFKSSGINNRPGSYRLGRLNNKYEVYYSPKGLDVDILLIGANAAQPAFNPVIIGETTAPTVERASASTNSPDTGYWLTGKAICQQNPVTKYAKSCATITVINTAQEEA